MCCCICQTGKIYLSSFIGKQSEAHLGLVSTQMALSGEYHNDKLFASWYDLCINLVFKIFAIPLSVVQKRINNITKILSLRQIPAEKHQIIVYTYPRRKPNLQLSGEVHTEWVL